MVDTGTLSDAFGKKLLLLGPIFGFLFFEALGLFGCLLGALLGVLRLSWETSGPQKP